MAKKKAKIPTLEAVLQELGDDIAMTQYKEGVPAISSGSLAMDVSIGIGGYPLGRFTELYGPEMGGKTTLCLAAAREALKVGKKVLFIDTENSLDYAYLEQAIGDVLDMERIVVVQPESGEQAFELAEAGIESDFDLIIFDSVAAISPKDELDQEFTDKQMMVSPRLVSHFLRRNVYKIRRKEIAFIFTNQVRANIGSYMGGYVTTGGNALKHYTSVRIYISRGNKIEETIDGNKVHVGNYINFTVKKNKVGNPYRQATTNIILGEGIDYYRDVISFASLLGVIKNRGPYYAFEGETIGSNPGVSATRDILADEPELLDKIVKACYNTANASMNTILSEEDENEGEDVDSSEDDE